MRILIACGGSAGHIYPGLALAEELRKEKQKQNGQIVFVVSGHPQDKRYLQTAAFLNALQIETVGTQGLPYRFSWRYIPFAFRLLSAFCKSFYLIFRYRPQVVVGFGGYSSFAPVAVASVLGISTLIHEQNLLPGRANRILAAMASKVTVSFGQTTKFFGQRSPKQNNKIVKTGFPLRSRILVYSREKLTKTNAQSKKFTILVVGGSLGAHKINKLVLSCLSRMDRRVLSQVKWIHLTGSRDYRYVQERYQSLGLDARVDDFLEDMAPAYNAADLLIARAGAGTIFEAASFKLPCILVPHPYGTEHQQENARHLALNSAAIVLDERTAGPEDLERMLLELIKNKRLRQDLGQRIRILNNPGAPHNLKQEVDALSK